MSNDCQLSCLQVLFSVARWTNGGRIILADPLPTGPYEVLWTAMFSSQTLTYLDTLKTNMADKGHRHICFRKTLFSTLPVALTWIMGLSEGMPQKCTISMIMQSFAGHAMRALQIEPGTKSSFKITWCDRPAGGAITPGRHLNNVREAAAYLEAQLGRRGAVELNVVDYVGLDFTKQVQITAASHVLMVEFIFIRMARYLSNVDLKLSYMGGQSVCICKCVGSQCKGMVWCRVSMVLE